MKPTQNAQLNEIKGNALKAFHSAQNSQELYQHKVQFLGKSGALTEAMKLMASLPKEEKPLFGKLVNEVKQELEAAYAEAEVNLKNREIDQQMLQEKMDLTIPAEVQPTGYEHPIYKVTHEIVAIMARLGYSLRTGPMIEKDYYNFEALNIPSHHPARAMHDTFYFDAHYLLRTHTSGVQIRTMEASEPPLRIICPGRVYRCDSDQTHSPMFHQMEGLMISKSSNFAELKGIIHEFLNAFFGKEMTVRFRPSFFPFTEPSAEVDILSDSGKWLEVLGCGMVHPQVLKNCGINPDEYTGFAFGLGIERFAMLYYGIDDLRVFFQNDVRFLRQFA